jgi:membrane-associated protease RseP (regulator of RpoE activity)
MHGAEGPDMDHNRRHRPLQQESGGESTPGELPQPGSPLRPPRRDAQPLLGRLRSGLARRYYVGQEYAESAATRSASLHRFVGTEKGSGAALRMSYFGSGSHLAYVLGLVYDEYRVEVKLGPVDALTSSLRKTWDFSVLTLEVMGKMLTGQVSVDNLSGPISIADSAGKSASVGLTYFVKFLAVVSISLGILNLLPVPILDGGHLLFFLIEAVRGSPLSEEAQMQAQKVGMMLLLALMTLAFYVDINRLLG